MPEDIERKLKEQVEKDHPGWSQERKDTYIYGTLQRLERSNSHWYWRKRGGKKRTES